MDPLITLALSAIGAVASVLAIIEFISRRREKREQRRESASTQVPSIFPSQFQKMNLPFRKQEHLLPFLPSRQRA